MLATLDEEGTVQLPIDCQPLVAPAVSSAFMRIFCVPANVLLKLRPRFNVRFVPAPTAEEFAPFSVHWLFCKLVLLPACIGPENAVPLSLSRYRLLLASTYAT